MKRKKILLSLMAGLSLSPALMAQSEMTAVTIAQAEESNGSARYQALSGAMGAVGVDFSSVAQNPAGIALLRRNSRVDLTMGYSLDKSKSQWYKNTDSDSKSALNFDQISANFRIGKGPSAWTFGIGLRNVGRSHRTLDAAAGGLDPYTDSSLADYAAAKLTISGSKHAQGIFNDNNANWFDAGANIPWIGAIGYGAGWVDYVPAQGSGDASHLSNYQYKNANGVMKFEAPSSVGLVIDEDYSIREMDLAMGYSISNRFHIGFLLASTSFDYTRTSSYSEGFRPSTDVKGIDGLSLNNYQSIQGVGAKFGLGLIAEPIKGLRLGASVYTPTFYNFEFDYSAQASGHNPFTPKGEDLNSKTPLDAASTFALSTPWRLGLSAAYIIKRYGLLSMDYEYSTFGSTRLRDDQEAWDSRNPYEVDNNALKEDFKGVHRLRLGTEFNLGKRLALRAGAKFETSPVKSSTLNGDTPSSEALVVGTMVHYALPQGKMGLSAGFGYRITPAWSIDLAYIYDKQKSDIYAFPMIEDPVDKSILSGLKPIKQTDEQHRLMFTLGFRF